ncbi:sulfotransferase family protein [[Actinomadura] parvosata]|uniref:sulfotransferase family protein n=1 Tax=[Actinomadura] parvosata TaxID=1955412 RepID=UPI0012BD3B80|nr:sulfotransferase [Nonomuraea sp. ATCC 55076]
MDPPPLTASSPTADTAWAVVLHGPPRPRSWLRRAHHAPFPAVAGLLARAVTGDARGVRRRYLFGSAGHAHAFAARHGAADVRPVVDEPFDRPVIIVAPPRSGGTLLFDALAGHPEVCALPGESEAVIEGVPELHPAARGYNSHALTAADARDAGRIVRWGLRADLPPGGARLVERTPENCLRLPFLLAALPGADVVFLRRDPKETVASMVAAWRDPRFVNVPELPGWSRGPWHLLLPEGWRRLDGAEPGVVAAHQWAAAVDAVLDARPLVPDGRWIDVDYADLRRSPGAVLGALSERLGLSRRETPADLPLSATAISPPVAGKWRRTPGFRPSVLDAHAATLRRLPQESTMIRPRPARPVLFASLLRDVPEVELARPRLAASATLQTGVSIPLALAGRTRFRERFLPGHPVLWVADRAGCLWPYWLEEADFLPVRALLSGTLAPLELPARLRGRLAGAGALVEPDQGDGFADAAKRFAGDGLCALDEVLPVAVRLGLARYYEQLIERGGWELGDAQVAGRYGRQNEPISRFVHHQLVHLVRRVAAEPVRPSYSYVSAYRSGAVLERHVDREQCEFTLSVLLEERGPGIGGGWPLRFDLPSGTVALTQRPGQGVLFRGTRLPHHRPELPPGNAHTSLLFHYVPAAFRRTLY